MKSLKTYFLLFCLATGLTGCIFPGNGEPYPGDSHADLGRSIVCFQRGGELSVVLNMLDDLSFALALRNTELESYHEGLVFSSVNLTSKYTSVDTQLVISTEANSAGLFDAILDVHDEVFDLYDEPMECNGSNFDTII